MTYCLEPGPLASRWWLIFRISHIYLINLSLVFAGPLIRTGIY